MKRRMQGGQALPLVVGGMLGLLGLSALVIDLGTVYAVQRTERAAADAAALAGAQDLQIPKSRVLDTAHQVRAVQDALANLVTRFGAVGTTPAPRGNCVATAGASTTDGSSVADCELLGTPYWVTVKTPSPSAVNVDPMHAVQVTVRQPDVSLTIARLFGQHDWNVGITSVAGLTFSGQYALVTLRPPNILPSLLDQNKDDVNLAGSNTKIVIPKGDVGTNSYVVTNSASYIQLAQDYRIIHYDNITPDAWNQIDGLPQGRHVNRFIPDPNYRYPSGISATSPDLNGYAQWPTQSAGALSSCPAGVPSAAWKAALSGVSTWTCYQPGVYTDNHPFKVGTGQGAYLMPGVYWFQAGLTVGGTLAGGLASAAQGVDLYFQESGTNTLSALNTENLVLNMGDHGCTAEPNCVQPATDASGTAMVTASGFVLTIEVQRDPSCFDGTTPRICSDNQNTTVNIGGNGVFEVAGVIYGPSDKMQINSNSTTQTGELGQIYAWTVKYSGGPLLSQTYPGGIDNGVLALDAACSGVGSTCNP